MRSIDDELLEALSSAAEQAGCELLHARWAGNVLQLVLDRPEGIGIADCESVSRRASALLDTLDFDPGRYVLEVSSPGLDREFYGPHDYQRFVGRLVRVRFTGPETGRPRTVVGRLEAFDAADGRVVVVEQESGQRLSLRLAEIEKTRLEVEI
jgi:ribosome maturation factor RimP